MSKHIDIAAYLHLAYGGIILLGALIGSCVITGGGWLSGDPTAIAITSGVGTIVMVVLLLLAAPSLIGGYALLRRYDWGRILVIVLSILDLFSFPIGTAVGGYSLWVLTRDEAVAEFA